MIKTILSPLFLIIVVVVSAQAHSVVRAVRGKPSLGSSVLSLICMVFLAIFSMQVFNRCIYALVERGVSDSVECPLDIVMVLGGGYYPGGEHEEDDVLGDESIARVKRGAAVYHACGAKRFVVSGRNVRGPVDRHAVLMGEFSEGLGIPKSALVLETDSRNTRDHPLFLEKMGIAGRDSRIAVITSPWHVKRAMREFERVFPNAVGVAAYQASYAKGTPLSVLDWMPMPMALERTTRPMHEIIGMAWYKVANVFQDAWGVDIDQYRK